MCGIVDKVEIVFVIPLEAKSALKRFTSFKGQPGVRCCSVNDGSEVLFGERRVAL